MLFVAHSPHLKPLFQKMLLDLLRFLLALVACVALALVVTLSITPESIFKGTPPGSAVTIFTLVVTVVAAVLGLADIVSDLLDAWAVRTGRVLRLVRTAPEKEHTAPR
jgi:hypothetical protein